jgi:hypothetical protein
MTFVKLDANILTSSVWLEDSDTVRVWMYLLVTAGPDGVVQATVPGIALQNGLAVARVQEILEKFSSPDPYSRTAANDGRRIHITLEPEYEIAVLNYAKYRAKDHTAAERQRRHRALERSKHVTRDRRDSHSGSQRVTQAEADLLLQKKCTSAADAATLSGSAPRRIEYPEWFTTWWKLYREYTGRGTRKRDTYQAARRLNGDEQSALVAVTEKWFAARARLEAARVFVGGAPDPVRFIQKRRWEDEFELPPVVDHRAPVSAEDHEALRRAREASEDPAGAP